MKNVARILSVRVAKEDLRLAGVSEGERGNDGVFQRLDSPFAVLDLAN